MPGSFTFQEGIAVSDLHEHPRLHAVATSDSAPSGDERQHDDSVPEDARASGPPDDHAFPRSHLVRTIKRHPVATAAVVAAVVFVGPAAIGRWGVRVIQAANRHAAAMAPLLGQLARVSGRR
jgi:hypothetical protein